MWRAPYAAVVPTPLPPHHAHCMGCGPENPAALNLRFAMDDGRVHAMLTLDDRHQGAPGFAHGGAVATALDDSLGTLLIGVGRPGVTARLEVNYRRPAFLGREYEIEAWVDEIDGRKIHGLAELRDAGGEVVADARALFVAVEPEHFLQGSDQIPEAWREKWWREGKPLPY